MPSRISQAVSLVWRCSQVLAPRRPVVHQHGVRQPIAAEGCRQGRNHAVAALVGTRSQHQRKPRVIVEHRQRMTAPAAAERKMPLEVHLPQLVGRRLLEALPRLTPLRCLGRNQPVAVQNAGDGVGMRHVAQPHAGAAHDGSCAHPTSDAPAAPPGPQPPKQAASPEANCAAGANAPPESPAAARPSHL